MPGGGGNWSKETAWLSLWVLFVQDHRSVSEKLWMAEDAAGSIVAAG